MELSLGARLKKAWNAFSNRDPTLNYSYGSSSSSPMFRPKFTRGNERSIVTAVLNRIATDAAAIDIKHVKLDDNDRYIETIDSRLNDCFSLGANLDQTGRAFIQDAVMSMLDEGVVCLVPVETTTDPKFTDSYDVENIRTGKIIEWYPEHVRVKLYNERTGLKEELTLPKRTVAIIENPFYAVMNETNSTLQRLIRKLNILDVIDEQSGSGKLDLIIKLPYQVKNQTKRDQAERRRKDIEVQLAESKYGIAYIDQTETITQLNRSVENNLMSQIEYLTSMLYSQLGITQSILDGTADDKTMLNYYNQTIEPILSAIVDEMKRKFLSKKARSQGQSIKFFRDPFRLVPLNSIAEIAGTFISSEILTPNDVRQIVGMKPSDDPKADELRNRNTSASNTNAESGQQYQEYAEDPEMIEQTE